jgi:hypothetical protein
MHRKGSLGLCDRFDNKLQRAICTFWKKKEEIKQIRWFLITRSSEVFLQSNMHPNAIQQKLVFDPKFVSIASHFMLDNL